jgi:predicted O-methyltransferase YrrM
MKVITEIEVPERWKITNDWDSHRPLLYLALKNSSGSVAEVGSGLGSTTLIREYCKEHERLFRSYETNIEWAQKTLSFMVYSYLRDYSEFQLVFIDCAPGELRKDLIDLNKNNELIVVHDTESGAEYVYGMADILSKFKYHLKFEPKGLPATSLISNFINVEEFI